MINFKSFCDIDHKLQQIIEYLEINNIPTPLIINEAVGVAEKGKVSNNTKGVLHELLVGKHLNGGKHMTLHPNEDKESPQQAHDRLKASIHPDDYKDIDNKAKSAAAHLRKHLESTGHNIHDVHWTSKPGDTEKVTGIKASQKEDSSDIYISSKHGNKITHHGVSLKVGKSKNVPSSSLGISSSGPKAGTIFNQHKKDIITSHPALAKMTKESDRKDWLKSHPKAAADIKQKNRNTLTKTAKALADHLKKQQEESNHEVVIKHLRTVLHAHNTPAQEHGHNFIKHTTYDTAKGPQHHISNPGLDYEHHFNHPEHIHIEHRGTSVVFRNKATGQKIATHSMKFESQSDPLSSLKSAGHPGH